MRGIDKRIMKEKVTQMLNTMDIFFWRRQQYIKKTRKWQIYLNRLVFFPSFFFFGSQRRARAHALSTSFALINDLIGLVWLVVYRFHCGLVADQRITYIN